MTQAASMGDVMAPDAEAVGPPAVVGIATTRRYAAASRAASTRNK